MDNTYFSVGDLVKSKIRLIKIGSSASYNDGNGILPVSLVYNLNNCEGIVYSVLNDFSYTVLFNIDEHVSILVNINKNDLEGIHR